MQEQVTHIQVENKRLVLLPNMSRGSCSVFLFEYLLICYSLYASSLAVLLYKLMNDMTYVLQLAWRWSGLRFFYQKVLRPLWVQFVVWRYTQTGLAFGSACSHIIHAGKPLSFDFLQTRYTFWKHRYEALGFQPLPKEIFEKVGGGWQDSEILAEKLYQPQ